MASARRLIPLAITGLFFASALSFGSSVPQSKKKAGPETFRATAKVTAAEGTGEAYLTIQIDRYTPERDIQAMEKALQAGGSTGFIDALRRAPVAGHVKVGERTFTIRWARERPTASGRVISIVTDAPVYFVGGGVPGANAKTGFDVAVLQLNMDSSGLGRGTMAAAARVKPGGPAGVEVDDYAAEPVKLAPVLLVIS